MSEELIIGRNPVLEALKSGRSVNKVMISEQMNQRTQRELEQASKTSGTVIQKVPKIRLDQLTDGQHQGVAAYVAAYQYTEVEDILAVAEARNELPFLIILDGLEDPHNLGSIMRTADATGAHGIIIPKHRSVGLTATVAKTSTGAIEYIPVARVTNIVDVIEDLKTKNIWIVGTDASGSEDFRTLDGETPIALVIGNEGKGMSRLVKESCDWTVNLPMRGKVSSLNASVASSLLLYEVYRKRYPLG